MALVNLAWENLPSRFQRRIDEARSIRVLGVFRMAPGPKSPLCILLRFADRIEGRNRTTYVQLTDTLQPGGEVGYRASPCSTPPWACWRDNYGYPVSDHDREVLARLKERHANRPARQT